MTSKLILFIRYYEILRPIYYLISRFPSDFVLQKQIDTFTKKCATVIAVSARHTTFENSIRDIKFLPKIALVWKERMTVSQNMIVMIFSLTDLFCFRALEVLKRGLIVLA